MNDAIELWNLKRWTAENGEQDATTSHRTTAINAFFPCYIHMLSEPEWNAWVNKRLWVNIHIPKRLSKDPILHSHTIKMMMHLCFHSTTNRIEKYHLKKSNKNQNERIRAMHFHEFIITNLFLAAQIDVIIVCCQLKFEGKEKMMIWTKQANGKMMHA